MNTNYSILLFAVFALMFTLFYVFDAPSITDNDGTGINEKSDAMSLMSSPEALGVISHNTSTACIASGQFKYNKYNRDYNTKRIKATDGDAYISTQDNTPYYGEILRLRMGRDWGNATEKNATKWDLYPVGDDKYAVCHHDLDMCWWMENNNRWNMIKLASTRNEALHKHSYKNHFRFKHSSGGAHYICWAEDMHCFIPDGGKRLAEGLSIKKAGTLDCPGCEWDYWHAGFFLQD